MDVPSIIKGVYGVIENSSANQTFPEWTPIQKVVTTTAFVVLGAFALWWTLDRSKKRDVFKHDDLLQGTDSRRNETSDRGPVTVLGADVPLSHPAHIQNETSPQGPVTVLGTVVSEEDSDDPEVMPPLSNEQRTELPNLQAKFGGLSGNVTPLRELSPKLVQVEPAVQFLDVLAPMRAPYLRAQL